MQLIIAKPSPYARKVRVALIEKGIAFETIVENPWLPGTRVPTANPLGKVPALILDDGTVVHDSKVIFEYLETLGTPPNLIPRDPARPRAADRSQADRGDRGRGLRRGRADHAGTIPPAEPAKRRLDRAPAPQDRRGNRRAVPNVG
jgi:glutathione S-transferase